MNMEQKLAYLAKCIEMGAKIEVNFHNFREQDEAEKAIQELSQLSGMEYKQDAYKETHWFRIGKIEEKFQTNIFFKCPAYLEEDVNFDGGEEVGA
jgi:hypothetical protein